MKPITEEQHQALIRHAKVYLAAGVRSKTDMLVEIALASLTAEPVAWVIHAHGGDQLSQDGGYVANAEGMFGLKATSLYTAPPVPVTKFPGISEFINAGGEMPAVRDVQVWELALSEIKRLNGLG